MSIQYYLNSKNNGQDLSFITIFMKQLPLWYLCALLTPVIIYFYERFPLDSVLWKKHLHHQIIIAFFILIIFAHPRLIAMNLITGQSLTELSVGRYINSYLSQIAWDTAIYAFIISVIFADKANSKRREMSCRLRKFRCKTVIYKIS